MSSNDPREPASTAVDYDPFAGDTLSRVVPTTEPQREIWLADRLGRDASLAFNESVSMRFRGRLDTAALGGALQALLARHSALRATIGPEGDTLCVFEDVQLALDSRDLASLSPSERDSAVRERLRLAVETPFVLQTDRLFRAELLCVGDSDHLLILTAHHIICDGWSWWVLVRELAALYAARIGEPAMPLPEPDDFADYALAEATHRTQETFAADEAYWLTRFAGEAPVLDLPADRPRPARRSFDSAREDYDLEAELVTAVRKLGARRGASLFATLLASFAGLLSRLTNQTRLVIGIPAAGQSIDGHDHLVGHCVNTLPLLFDLDMTQPIAKAIDDAQHTLLDAWEHQRYTFGTMLRKLKIHRDPARLPLINVMFNIDQALDQESAAFPGLELDFSSNARSFENFELFINAVQTDGKLRLECQYNRGLFDAATIRTWMGYWRTLLESMVADEVAVLGRLPLLGESERRRVLETWNDTRVDFPPDRCVHDLFEEQVAKTPSAIALEFEGTRLSYLELNEKANRLAHHLVDSGVSPDDRIAICVERGMEMVIGMLAVLKAGGAYVPLDPAYPAERLEFMLQDSAPRMVLIQGKLENLLGGLGTTLPLLDLTSGGSAWENGQSDNPLRTRIGLAPHHLAYVIYTSGSTGKPKGVMLEHSGVCNYLQWAMREYKPVHGSIVSSSFSFDATVTSLFTTLMCGGTVRVLPERQEIDGLLAAMRDENGCGLVKITPAHLDVLGKRLQASGGNTNVDVFVVGGEALAAATVRLWRDVQPGVRMVNEYGPTETVVGCCIHDIPLDQPASGAVPIGRPIANTQLYILDQFREPVPTGVAGELYIAGAGVARGYLNRAQLTGERFLADPFARQPGARMYRTGDLARWLPDGNIDYLGRNDFQVKVRGYRIELGEIESQLDQEPGVAQAVVVTREDRPGDTRLVAYVVARESVVLEEAALQAQLRKRLPEYMVPQHIVALDAVPLLPNGKIDRKALPAPQRPASADNERIAPRDEREQRVCAAMEEILALPELGIHDDFFAMGGHSLLAAQLTTRLNREFGITLSFRTLFDAPTIAGLAAAIGAQLDRDDVVKTEPIVRRATQDRAPLSLMQQRLWFIEELNPGRVSYHGPSAHRLRGRLDESAFQRAFAEMVRHQPILRTAFRREDDEVFQIVEPALDLELFPAEDLGALAADGREAALMQRLQELTDTPFDLTRAPLFRAHMFRLGPDDHVLFFMPHHIIWDGWSFDLLYVELTELYRAFMAGRPSPLAELPVTYGDFAVWHTRWLEGPQLQTQLAFWRERLADTGEPRSLPTDKPRRPGMSGEGRTEWIRVSREQTDALHAVARSADATLNMTMLALYYVLLYGSTGQRDLVIGTPVRGRNQTEVESVMGYFTNLVPLHISVNPALAFVDFVREVKRVVVDSFGNPDVPLEYLQRELKVRHGSGGAILYQALFSFQDARQRITDWGGLAHEQILLFQRGATEDLGLWLLENNQGMVGGVTYNADILRADTACTLRDGYLELFTRVIADARQPLSALARIGDADLALISRWNAATTDLPATTRLSALVEAQVDRAPTATALSLGSWGTSYAEIEQRANRIAACLRKRGVATGSVVALAVEPSVNRVVGLLGILKAGGVCVPLDPADPPTWTKALLADAHASVLVGDSKLETALAWPRERALWFDADTAEIIGSAADRETGADTDADAAALIIYSPDARGRPQARRFTHRAVATVLEGLRHALDIGSADRILGSADPDSGTSMLECLLPLVNGAEFVQASRSESANGDALSRLVASARASVVFASADTWQRMLAAASSGEVHVKAVCVGGTPRPELGERIAARFGELWNALATDAVIVASCGRIASPRDGVDVGKPLANVPAWVLDADGQPRPVGSIGEICVGGIAASGAPDGSDAVSVAAANGRLIRTGYRGRWLPGGRIEELGHLDRRIQLNGRAVEPAQIEAQLLAQPDIERAIAVAREDRAGAVEMVAYVVSRAGAAADASRLRGILESTLPAHAIPKQIVALEILPTRADGSVDMAALPAPPAVGGDRTGPGDEPETDAERLLAGVWAELLGVPRVGSGDNFFDLGGHSLLAMAMVARVEKQTRVRMNLMKIANSTLRALAAELPQTISPATADTPASLGQRVRNLFGLRKPRGTPE